VTDRFGLPAGGRSTRAVELARERATDELAGRTVWCATAVASDRGRAQELLEWLSPAAELSAAPLDVTPDDRLRELADRLEAILTGPPPVRQALGLDDQQAFDDAVQAGESLVGGDVRPGDVVVLHDPLTAALARAIRERGAHAVWHVRGGAAPSEGEAAHVRDFLQRYTSVLDAYVMTWIESTGRGFRVERIAALVPSADLLAAKDVGRGHADVGWSSVLADVVHSDREETVGGRLHARPTIAVR
jgi:trehalose synthase